MGVKCAVLEGVVKEGVKEQRRDQQLSTSLLDRNPRSNGGTVTGNQPVVDTHEDEVMYIIP